MALMPRASARDLGSSVSQLQKEPNQGCFPFQEGACAPWAPKLGDTSTSPCSAPGRCPAPARSLLPPPRASGAVSTRPSPARRVWRHAAAN